MNGFLAHMSEWLLSVPRNAGSQSKNRLWDKLPNCSLEGLRDHMPVFLLRISMFLKAKLNPVLLCVALSVREAERSGRRLECAWSWAFRASPWVCVKLSVPRPSASAVSPADSDPFMFFDWFLSLRLHEWWELVMYVGWDRNHLLCIPQVFSPGFCLFFFLLILCWVFMSHWSACPLWPLLEKPSTDVVFTYVSRWLTALMFDPGII